MVGMVVAVGGKGVLVGGNGVDVAEGGIGVSVGGIGVSDGGISVTVDVEISVVGSGGIVFVGGTVVDCEHEMSIIVKIHSNKPLPLLFRISIYFSPKYVQTPQSGSIST